MTSPPLLSLPNEVLVEIFSYLHPRNIVACQRCCRKLNDTVIHSRLLRYLIQVGRSGLHDPLLPGYTIPQRMEALEKWGASWSYLETKGPHHMKDVLACHFKWRDDTVYMINDDFLIATCCFNEPEYAYIDLRAFQPEEKKDPWTRITDHSWSGKKGKFTFSMEQDLVLAVLSPVYISSSMFIELHGIRFSRGTPHPYVIDAAIPTEIQNSSIDVVILGDRTILNVSTRVSQRIYLHSWKDGHVSLLREASQKAWSLKSAMLSRDMIVLVETDSATLELCKIVEEPDRRTPSLCTIVRLGLPPLAPGAFIRHSYCSREIVPAYSDAPSLAIEGRPPRRFPFHSSPEEGLVTIIITVQVDDMVSWFTFVTPLRTLVALATTTPPGVTLIPWENWGLRATACFISPFLFHSEPQALMGERCVTISRGRLFLYDFNSTRIQDAIRRTGNPSGRHVYVSTVEHRSIIHRGRFFRKDVVSELPYISVNVPVPLGWRKVVNYEEGLAGFSTDTQERKCYVQVIATE